MKAVLLDTGCIVALLDRSEQHHEKAVEVVHGLREPLITCEAVIAEACYLLRNTKGAAQAILSNVQSGAFQISFALARRAAHVAKLLKKYADVPMDLADACLVDLASQIQVARILTLDGDFRIYRWGKNRSFQLLLDGD